MRARIFRGYGTARLGVEANADSVCRTAGLGLALAVANAQDTRNITEPAIPSSCLLTVRLSAINGNKTLAETDEDRPDTARIQQVIGKCPQGQAVELRADDAHNAFLSGARDLRTGITVRIDANTVLFGSRNPRD